MNKLFGHRLYLYIEILVLMVGIPLLLSTLLPIRYLLPTMWLMALYCHVIYRALVDASERIYWRWKEVNWMAVRPILLRWAINTAMVVALILWFKPELFLNFVKQSPAFWAVVMVLYPVLSVVPQEIIFRSFFFQRYGQLFRTQTALIIASGLLFGAAHLIFQNWVAPALCVIGGILFARTYAKTKSLALVSLEHALYGDMVFTVGLGRYFYHGAVGPH